MAPVKPTSGFATSCAEGPVALASVSFPQGLLLHYEKKCNPKIGLVRESNPESATLTATSVGDAPTADANKKLILMRQQ